MKQTRWTPRIERSLVWKACIASIIKLPGRFLGVYRRAHQISCSSPLLFVKYHGRGLPLSNLKSAIWMERSRELLVPKFLPFCLCPLAWVLLNPCRIVALMFCAWRPKSDFAAAVLMVEECNALICRACSQTLCKQATYTKLQAGEIALPLPSAINALHPILTFWPKPSTPQRFILIEL